MASTLQAEVWRPNMPGVRQLITYSIMLQYFHIALCISPVTETLFTCWSQMKNVFTSMVVIHTRLFITMSGFQHRTRRMAVTMVLLMLLAVSVVKASLLLKCGDVEENPGPDGEIYIVIHACSVPSL